GQLSACDVVVHCAAFVEAWGTHADAWGINVDGTDRVLAAAKAAGASRFVHMSTEAVLWRGQHLRDVTESHPYPKSTPYLYSETKGAAERRVLAANGPGFETVILRPRFVWGPGDKTLAPEIKAMVESGAFLWLDEGRARTSTTHVANLVHATELALTKGKAGEIYFVTDGKDSAFRSFLPRLMACYGVELGERSLPSWLARPAAALVEGVWRGLRLKSTPPVTRHAIDLMCCDCTLNTEKIKAELGYAPILGVDAGLEQLTKHLRAQQEIS
ncbi:MAG: NAD-dependent epimerase/dehydratase family protein, partial [Deltaproteobacteria bacterium]|nr:NAD-dependent epimerase/dehydratase family protein [Deltaproteobacteria bacterium]